MAKVKKPAGKKRVKTDDGISVATAASILGLSQNGVLKRIHTGSLKAVRFTGKAWMISRKSAEGKVFSQAVFDAAVSKYCNVTEACEILGVTDNYVVQLINRGDIDGFRLHGKTWIVFKRSAEKNAKEYVPNAAPGRLRRVTSGKRKA